MDLQIFSARSSNSTKTVFCPGLTFPPSGLPLGENCHIDNLPIITGIEPRDLVSCGDATVTIGTVCYEVYL